MAANRVSRELDQLRHICATLFCQARWCEQLQPTLKALPPPLPRPFPSAQVVIEQPADVGNSIIASFRLFNEHDWTATPMTQEFPSIDCQVVLFLESL